MKIYNWKNRHGFTLKKAAKLFGEPYRTVQDNQHILHENNLWSHSMRYLDLMVEPDARRARQMLDKMRKSHLFKIPVD